MTIDRYEEALKRAKEFVGKEECINLEYIFPELVESEDEKIRKSLINYVYCHGDAGDFTKKEFIAWIKKQSRKDAVNINLSEFDSRLNTLLKQFEKLPKEELTNSLAFYLNVVQNNGFYQEQKPAKWSEDDEWMLNEAINAVIVSDYAEGRKEMCIDWLKSLKDRYTWKPSVEQMVALDWALSLAKNCGEGCAFDLRTLQDQLKKLRD